MRLNIFVVKLHIFCWSICEVTYILLKYCINCAFAPSLHRESTDSLSYSSHATNWSLEWNTRAWETGTGIKAAEAETTACSDLAHKHLQGWLGEILYTKKHLRSVKVAPKCITRDTEVCKSIARVHESIVIVSRDWMAITCKLLRFATVIQAVSPYCLTLCYW